MYILFLFLRMYILCFCRMYILFLSVCFGFCAYVYSILVFAYVYSILVLEYVYSIFVLAEKKKFQKKKEGTFVSATDLLHSSKSNPSHPW